MEKHYSDDVEQVALESADEMQNFNQWMYDQAKPWMGDHVLEAGAGIGTYSDMAWQEGKKVSAIELSANYYNVLQERFKDKERFEGVLGSITDPTAMSQLENKGIDTIISFNVLEHVEEDEEAFKQFYSILAPGGHAVVLVPAHMFLHNSIDAEIGHIRRYSKKELRRKAEKAGFTVKRIYFFNSLAILGWFVNGNILKKKKVDQGATRLFDKLIPIIRWIDKYILMQKIGISLVIIAEKKRQ